MATRATASGAVMATATPTRATFPRGSTEIAVNDGVYTTLFSEQDSTVRTTSQGAARGVGGGCVTQVLCVSGCW